MCDSLEKILRDRTEVIELKTIDRYQPDLELSIDDR
jgi:hypothetical protein